MSAKLTHMIQNQEGIYEINLSPVFVLKMLFETLFKNIS